MVGYSLASKWPIMVLFCGMNHQKSKYLFLMEAAEVSRYYFFKNCLIKLKYPNFRISVPPSKKILIAYWYLSGSIHEICLNMKHPVLLTTWNWNRNSFTFQFKQYSSSSFAASFFCGLKLFCKVECVFLRAPDVFFFCFSRKKFLILLLLRILLAFQ